MPEFDAVAKVLVENKIPTASFLLAGTAESRKDATVFLSGDGKNMPGHWLIDTDKNSLASSLRISSFPTVVLVSGDGRILFNGDPADARLWKKLSGLNPAIKPPTIDPVLPQNDENGLPPAEEEKN